MLRRTREFFDQRGFVEVQTPLLSHDTVVDRHLDPVAVHLPHDPRHPAQGRALWLQTSPEFAMKRLLASGMEAIYQLAVAVRCGEVGRQHNPEFTMLEWYRRDDTLATGMALLGDFVSQLLALPSAEVQTVREACETYLGCDPLVCSSRALRDHYLSRHPEEVSAHPDWDGEDWDLWFDLLFSEVVQPQLGADRPTIICDYPASQSALSRIRPGDPPVSERFELFVQGIELANGYHELLDADELVLRQLDVNQLRRHDGKLELPLESRLLEAMRAGLPPSVGVALGFDRLVMLATGAKSVAEVIAFPIDRA